MPNLLNLVRNLSKPMKGFLIFALILLVFSIGIVSTLSNSYAENEPYVLSHFSAKGTITENNPFSGAVFWTQVNGDKGIIVTSSPNGVVVFRLDMKQSDACPELPNTVCLDSTITSIKNSQYGLVKVGDQAKMVFEMPKKQTITMQSGDLEELVFELDISKMKVKDVEKIVEKNIEEEILDDFMQESSSKIREALKLVYSPEIQSILKDSNAEFFALEKPYALIDERNDEWILAEDDEVTPFMETILGNKASTFIQNVLNKDKMKPTDFVYAEIILTNAYGANVAITGKTTDYKQWDEQWWIIAKQDGVSMKNGFDESAGVQSLDMSFRIQDEYGRFLGVVKFVINTEKLF